MNYIVLHLGIAPYAAHHHEGPLFHYSGLKQGTQFASVVLQFAQSAASKHFEYHELLHFPEATYFALVFGVGPFNS